MGIETNGVQLFGSPVQAREFRCNGSVTKHSSITTGVLHTIQVPRGAYRRNIWLAFDALRSSTTAGWYLIGKIVFWLNGAKITEFPISKGNQCCTIDSINIFAPSTGAGMQPALRATAYEIFAKAYKSIDLPCFTFDVECDKITLEVEQMSLGSGLVWSDVAITNGGTGYYQNNLDAGSAQYWKWDYFDGIIHTLTDNAAGTLSTVAGTATPSVIYDVKTKALVRKLQDQIPSLAAGATLSLSAQGGAGGSGATFVPVFDGIANLMTGLIVASQYPGGL